MLLMIFAGFKSSVNIMWVGDAYSSEGLKSLYPLSITSSMSWTDRFGSFNEVSLSEGGWISEVFVSYIAAGLELPPMFLMYERSKKLVWDPMSDTMFILVVLRELVGIISLFSLTYSISFCLNYFWNWLFLWLIFAEPNSSKSSGSILLDSSANSLWPNDSNGAFLGADLIDFGDDPTFINESPYSVILEI